MKYLALLLVPIFLWSCSPSQKPYDLLINDVNVIDVQSGLRTNQSVAITGKQIVGVGSAQEFAGATAQVVVEGKGKFLIPGLWDTHVHLSYEEDLSPAMFDLFLAHGVTSIRDTGGQLDLVIPWKEESLKDDGTTPRVMIAGPLLDGVPTVYNGEGGRPKLGLGAGNPDEARALVVDFVDRDVDLIKSYEMLTPESFAAVLEASTAAGRVVTGHVPLSMDVIEASDLGLRSMEHMRNLEMSCSSDYDSLLQVRRSLLLEGARMPGGDLRSSIHSAQRYHSTQTQDPQRTAEVLDALARNGTWQVPTLTIVMAMTNRVFDRPEWVDQFKYLPASARERWESQAEQALNLVPNETHEAYSQWALEMIKKVSDRGIGIMAGTDTPIFFLTPGVSLHEELKLMVDGGLTPMQALEAATLKPAEYFGLENELGKIEEGHWADLVLLDENPLEDINHTKGIQAVVKSGRLYDRQGLDKMLQQLEAN